MTWQNVGLGDRIIRLVVCSAMFAIGWLGSLNAPWDGALQIFAFPGWLTAAIGWDPVYALMGLSTRPPEPPA